MDISINNNISSRMGTVVGAQEATPVGKTQESTAKRDLTITHSDAAPDGISAAAIPESALTRDDELGNLVKAAFNLQAPPMPAFVE